jgi:UDP-glucose 4-epimerase
MKKILVTGGTGYIGSHTVVELLNHGFEVIIADNLCNSHLSVVDAIEQICQKRPLFEKIELADSSEVNQLFEKHKDIDGVIHFAALKAVGESSIYPLKYYHNNLFSLINVLNAMQQNGVNNFVFSSSCTVYGQPEQLPVFENTPVVKAVSPYGNTKKISEEIISETSNTTSIKSIILRYFNPIGAHPSAKIGELPVGSPDNLIPFITQTVAGKRDVLKIFGTDYNTPDGTCIRDYLHVVDLAKAHVVALKRMVLNKSSDAVEIFNLGTGTGNSVLEIVNTFEKVTGLKVPTINASRRPGDAEQIWANVDKATTVLGWQAELSLDEMLLSAWNWEKQQQIASQNHE